MEVFEDVGYACMKVFVSLCNLVGVVCKNDVLRGVCVSEEVG